MSGTSISGTPTREQDWTLDQLGNWPGFVVKAAGTTTLDQTRYHNAVNEIDGNGGNSITSSGGTPNWRRKGDSHQIWRRCTNQFR